MNLNKQHKLNEKMLYSLFTVTIVVCIVIVSFLIVHNRIEANFDMQISALQEELTSVQQEHVELQRQHDEVLNKLDALINPAPCDAAAIPVYDIALSEELQRFTHVMCESYGIGDKYTLVLAMMKVESNYNPNLISATNDYGLMQINECNHAKLRQKLGIVDFLDPEQSIEAGVYMISTLLNKYETDEKALMAYNLGEGGAASLWNYGKYSTNYTDKVLAAQELIESKLIQKT